MEEVILKDYEVICKIPTGSQLFCKNCRDEDWLICVKECSKQGYEQRFSDGIDYFIRDEKTTEKIATASPAIFQGLYGICVPIAIKNGTIVGELPIANYNWFDYKDNIITSCLQYLGSARRKINLVNREACCKTAYWLFANYFALVNNSLEFTDEQKEILQKCHDNELPRTYADELYQNLIEMKNNL